MATNQVFELHVVGKGTSKLGESLNMPAGIDREEGVIPDTPGPGANGGNWDEAQAATPLFRVSRAAAGGPSPPPSRSIPKSAGFQVSCRPGHRRGQKEAEEPLLVEAKICDCTSDSDYILRNDASLLNQPVDGELRSRIGLVGGLALCPLCQGIEKSPTLTESSASLNGQAPSAVKSNHIREITSYPVLCPAMEEQWPCVALPPCPASEEFSFVLCQSLLEQSKLSDVLCPPLEQSPSLAVPCPPGEQKMPTKEVCDSKEEKAFSTELCLHFKEQANNVVPHSPLKLRIPSLKPLSCVGESGSCGAPCPCQKQTILVRNLCPVPEEGVSLAVACCPLEQSLPLVATDALVENSVETLTAQLENANQHSRPSVDDDSDIDQRSKALQWLTEESSRICSEDEEAEHMVCPICTEQYDADKCRQAMLNCGHTVCDSCVKAIMDQSGQADIGRVKCPLCRQKTPMMKWEIRKLQEEMLERDCSLRQSVYVAPIVTQMRPGPWGALEYNFKQRFHSSRMFSCIPCLRYPICFIERLDELERHSRCCYLCILVLLYCVEKLCFLAPFLPILMLILIIVLDK